MKIVKTAVELTKYLNNLRKEDKSLSIGFVPTMGALHQGHLSLIKKSVLDNDLTICSIFVNPVQFGEKKDLDTYPRPIESDIEKLLISGCNILFLPEVEDIYPPEYSQITFDLAGLDFKIEGKQRPGHFQGVCNVINRFFEIIAPNKAYFGQKDFQQTVVVKHLVKLLGSAVDIIVCPIEREENGLAMSSRNQRLSSIHRSEADFIFKTLSALKKEAPLIGLDKALSNARHSIEQIDEAKIEYLLAVDQHTLDEVHDITSNTIILTVVKFHGVRLLDNILLN